MAANFLEVLGFEVERRKGGGLLFYARLHYGDGPMRVAVPPEALLCYRAFQEHLLNSIGVVFRHVRCEGKRAEAADEAWRCFTDLSGCNVPMPEVKEPSLN